MLTGSFQTLSPSTHDQGRWSVTVHQRRAAVSETVSSQRALLFWCFLLDLDFLDEWFRSTAYPELLLELDVAREVEVEAPGDVVADDPSSNNGGYPPETERDESLR